MKHFQGAVLVFLMMLLLQLLLLLRLLLLLVTFPWHKMMWCVCVSLL